MSRDAVAVRTKPVSENYVSMSAVHGYRYIGLMRTGSSSHLIAYARVSTFYQNPDL